MNEKSTEQVTLGGEETTELVNVSKAGRSGVRMIDRSSKVGNPFRMEKDGGEYTREGCVEAYEEWFVEKIAKEPEFRETVESLRGETLGCWCVSNTMSGASRPYDTCHGEIILAYLRGDLDVE